MHAVESGGGAGVWLPESYARTAHAHPGDRITMAGAPVTSAGVYTDLYDTVPGAYWCDYSSLFLNLASANTAAAAAGARHRPGHLLPAGAAAESFNVTERVPTDRTGLSVTEAAR